MRYREYTTSNRSICIKIEAYLVMSKQNFTTVKQAYQQIAFKPGMAYAARHLHIISQPWCGVANAMVMLSYFTTFSVNTCRLATATLSPNILYQKDAEA